MQAFRRGRAGRQSESAARQLRDDLKAALDAVGGEEAAAAAGLTRRRPCGARTSRSGPTTEIAALRERLDTLMAEGAAAERLRAELIAARGEADDTRQRIEAARAALRRPTRGPSAWPAG